MKTGLAISALSHAALLLWGLISFAAKPLEAKPTDALPVDIISDKRILRDDQGREERAEGCEAPKPLVEKIVRAKPVDDSTAKVTPKKEIDAAPNEPQPPPPAPESEAQAGGRQAREEAGAAQGRSDRRGAEEGRGEEEGREARREGQGRAEEAEAGRSRSSIRPGSPRCSTSATRSGTPPTGDHAQPERRRSAAAAATQPCCRRARSTRCARASGRMLESAGRRLPNARNLKVVMRILFKQDGSVAGRAAAGRSGTASPFQVRRWRRAPCARS